MAKRPTPRRPPGTIERMRALSIRQPWAALIVIGAKRIETRSKPTRYRGPLAIHASMAWGPAERHWARTAAILPWLQRAGLDEADLPRGVVLGTVHLVDSLPFEELGPRIDERTTEGTRERMMGRYQPGWWGWLLEQAHRFDTPIPAKGQLSIWTWTP